MQITINNLTLNLSAPAGQARNPFAELLEQVRSMVAELPDYDGEEGEADEQEAAAQEPAKEERCETPSVQPSDVLAFLKDKSRFKRRTFAAIRKAFPGALAGEVYNCLNALIVAGEARSMTRRDGKDLYEAL